jgi:hypothetical protein
MSLAPGYSGINGYHIRRLVVFKAHVPDLVAAVAEDAITIAGGLLIVSHLSKLVVSKAFSLLARRGNHRAFDAVANPF